MATPDAAAVPADGDQTPGNEEEPVSGAAFTCRFTAALRHVETTRVENPVLKDPLAPLLCGAKALRLAEEELAGLQKAQGPGKHLRVPARTRLMEDQLVAALALQSQEPAVQVVSLGCGMDTRPWRVQQLQQGGCQVHWFDVDQPDLAQLKLASLQSAGAQVAADSAGPVPSPAFPLLCRSYAMVGADLSVVPLKDALVPRGFRTDLPTVWVAEAVIYYISISAANALLQAMAELSAPGSRAILTCVDTELLEASRSRMHASHIFANLWHFDVGEMCACDAYQRWWVTRLEPRSTRELALELLGAETYVALYGGSECVVVADLKTNEC